MGKPSRDKGRRGAREAMALLSDRDYTVVETRDGCNAEDAVAICPKTNKAYSVEIKNVKAINVPYFIAQARRQAQERKLAWMLLAKIDGGYGWLMLRQGDRRAAIWHSKEAV